MATKLTCLIVVNVYPCTHCALGFKQIKCVEQGQPSKYLFDELHGRKEDVEVAAKVSTSLTGENLFTVDASLTIGELKGFYSEIKSLHLKCPNPAAENEIPTKQTAAQAVDAFNILMSGQRVYPKKKSYNRKDELYNAVVDDMVERDLKFHKSVVDDEGTYVAQFTTNSLWYLTNQNTTINETVQRFKNLFPVPPAFDMFQGYDDYKRKKVKCQPLSSVQCQSHANTLFSIACRPVFQSNKQWFSYKSGIEDLGNCILQYKKYLDEQLQKQTKNTPVHVRTS